MVKLNVSGTPPYFRTFSILLVEPPPILLVNGIKCPLLRLMVFGSYFPGSGYRPMFTRLRRPTSVVLLKERGVSNPSWFVGSPLTNVRSDGHGCVEGRTTKMVCYICLPGTKVLGRLTKLDR